MTHPLKSSCLCVQGNHIPKIRFLSKKMTKCSIGFWFRHLIKGYRPKMGRKITIFLILPKFRPKVIFVWNKCHPPLLGVVDDKKWCPFFYSGVWVSTIPKMVDKTLGSYEYHFRANFGQILKIVNSWLIVGWFPCIKSQNQNPMLHLINFWG